MGLGVVGVVLLILAAIALQHLHRRLGGAVHGAVLGHVLQGCPCACAVPAVYGRGTVRRRGCCSSCNRDVGVVLRPVVVITSRVCVRNPHTLFFIFI